MNKKIQASAMYYALFLSIVIALVLGSMVLFSGMNRQFASMLEIEEILQDNANSGIEYAQANYAELENNNPVFVRLFQEGIDSVQLKKKKWGAFTVLESTAVHGKNSFTKISLAGQVSNNDDPNLYVADQGRPIAICGETRLEGKLALPESGLKRAYIEGKNYTGDKMIYGTEIPSSRNLPAVSEAFLNEVNSFDATVQPWDNEEDSIQVSFTENAQHFISDQSVSLENIFLDGQIIIESKDSIYVSASAQLNHVILKSPVVYFASGFVGNVQVFATERVECETGVLLKYPSVVGLVEELFPTEKSAEIKLHEKSQIIGSVFLLSKNENFRMPVQLTIGKEAAIDGFAYCQGRTQLEGTVNGHLFTGKFYLKTNSSTYENHLLDAKITNQLPDEFVYIPLLKNDQALTRLSWLQ